MPEREVQHTWNEQEGDPAAWKIACTICTSPFLVMLDQSSGGCEHFQPALPRGLEGESTGGTGSLPRAPVLSPQVGRSGAGLL